MLERRETFDPNKIEFYIPERFYLNKNGDGDLVVSADMLVTPQMHILTMGLYLPELDSNPKESLFKPITQLYGELTYAAGYNPRLEKLLTTVKELVGFSIQRERTYTVEDVLTGNETNYVSNVKGILTHINNTKFYSNGFIGKYELRGTKSQNLNLALVHVGLKKETFSETIHDLYTSTQLFKPQTTSILAKMSQDISEIYARNTFQ